MTGWSPRATATCWSTRRPSGPRDCSRPPCWWSAPASCPPTRAWSTACSRASWPSTAFIKVVADHGPADANTALAALTGKALKASELATAWSDMTFTNDPMASSIQTDVAHAKAAGFATTNIKGIFDLGPINQLLTAAGKAPLTS